MRRRFLIWVRRRLRTRLRHRGSQRFERVTCEGGHAERATWDERARPTVPGAEPDRSYTEHELAAGRHLVDVHDALRSELATLRGLVDQVGTGASPAAEARSHLNTMAVRQHNWTLGAYCASYCRVVATHHTIEDRSMFPHLRRADSRLAPVIDRLEDEHHIIAGLLESVDQALVAFINSADALPGVRAEVDTLSQALLSHLSYEERELVEPLSRLGFY